MEAYGVQQKVFIVRGYYESGNSVVRAQRKFRTKLLDEKNQ
jgi:hypothetical protein